MQQKHIKYKSLHFKAYGSDNGCSLDNLIADNGTFIVSAEINAISIFKSDIIMKSLIPEQEILVQKGNIQQERQFVGLILILIFANAFDILQFNCIFDIITIMSLKVSQYIL
ncbi:unnamed protein product [Paramecium primaurelia]|uniref:Uncharacterized protein n=1 Tax=Paramecium primaurelia TaxID=5886 RepID=A0A8S1KWV0_PARPR|nr:unnamed protein product [Paramecium primaurelia]